MTFKAFISYSHAADGQLAPAVQRALHGIAKPWYRLRTMRVFRDQANLSASPGLWTSIESALRDSEFFLFMASPTASQSPWVQKEVEWWLTNRSEQSFLILLTEGDIAWDATRVDFDWNATTALPDRLTRVFEEEPLYADLRWARTADELSVRHSRFRSPILELAATLLGRPKDELDGDDVRQYRRTKRIAWCAAGILAALFIVAVLAAYLATQQRDLAVSRALGASAEAVLPTNPELALLLAREAVRVQADDQAEFVLREVFARHPLRIIHHAPAGRNVVADFVGAEFIMAAEPGGRAAVWSVADGRRVTELPLEVGDDLALGRSTNGSLVALQAGEDTFSVYDAKNWTNVAALPGSHPRFIRSGAVLVALAGNELRQWDAPSLRERQAPVPLPDGYVLRDVSADGGLFLAAEDGDVSSALVIAAESGRTLATLPTRILREGALFSPDGGLVVTQPLDETRFELWEPRTGRLVRTLEEPEPNDIGWTTYVTFSPDGETFVTGNRNGVLHLWNVQTGEFIRPLYRHRNDIARVLFAPDGKTMLTTAADGTACLWDTASMRCLVTLGGSGDDAWDAKFAADGVHFLTTHLDGTVRLWHREAWYPSITFAGENAVVSEDGRLVLAAAPGGSIQLWDAQTGELEAKLEGPAGEVESMALGPGDSLFAVAPTDGAVRLWHAGTGKQALQLSDASVRTTALAFSPDGTRVVTGSEEGRVRFWDARNASLLREWQPLGAKVTDLLFHPDGKSVAVAIWDGQMQLRNVESGEVVLAAKLDEEGTVVQDLALNANGSLLLISGDKNPQVWDLAALSRLQTLTGHTDEVYSSAFSRDGRFIVTGSGYMHARGEPPEDGNGVRLWDATSGRELLHYRSAGLPVNHVAFGSDDITILAASMDGTVRAYRCEVCLPLPALSRLAASRSARGLSAQERQRYLPSGTLLETLMRD